MEPSEPEIELTEIPRKRRIGISGILSSLGGFLFLGAFFLPLFNTAAALSWDRDEVPFLHLILEQGEKDLTEESDIAEWKATREIIAVMGIDQYMSDVSAAEKEEDYRALVEKHSFSIAQSMQAILLVHKHREILTPDKETHTTLIWVLFGLGWLFLIATVAAILPLILRIPPLNGFQMSWNGTFGLVLFIGSLLLLIGTNRFDYISSVRVSYIQPLSAFTFITGGFFIWISAFAGLNRTNWWKGPLYGVFLIAFCAGTFLATSRIFLT